jgi:hypothetical protein
VLLVTKFTEGAWVVVLAIPAFTALFVQIHGYYQRAGRALGFGRIPPKPQGKRSVVVVPVTGVSLLTEHAIVEALSISKRVVAVSVVLADDGDSAGRERELQEQWAQWNPGVPLRVLHIEFASVVQPIVAFIDELRERRSEQIVVLIPVVLPERLRYTLLHNHLDLVLANALRSRADVVVARVPMTLPTNRAAEPRDA